jgi:hypothetical protein
MIAPLTVASLIDHAIYRRWRAREKDCVDKDVPS